MNSLYLLSLFAAIFLTHNEFMYHCYGFDYSEYSNKNGQRFRIGYNHTFQDVLAIDVILYFDTWYLSLVLTYFNFVQRVVYSLNGSLFEMTKMKYFLYFLCFVLFIVWFLDLLADCVYYLTFLDYYDGKIKSGFIIFVWKHLLPIS